MWPNFVTDRHTTRDVRRCAHDESRCLRWQDDWFLTVSVLRAIRGLHRFARTVFAEFNNVYLERLPRNLKGRAAVFVPFAGDVEETRDEVLSKDWTSDEDLQVSQVPSLLVISKDFDDFSPRSDPWVIFHFGEEQFGGAAGLAELDKTLKAIASSVMNPGESHRNLYQIARQVTRERPDLGLAFAVQPNIFGFSIDLMKAGSYLRGPIQDRRRPVGHQPRT
jgi:hypothetical protein